MPSPRKSLKADAGHRERIAVLETKVDSLSADMTSIQAQLQSISEGLSRNKGFWGAVVLIGSAIWAAVAQFGSAFVDLFHSSPKG